MKNLKEKHGIEVEKSDVEEFHQYCDEVEKLTSLFHRLDRNSDSFRYPVDKKNIPSFEEDEKLNLLDIEELYNKSMVLFKHTVDVFSKYTDFADQIELMYEEQMRDYHGY